MGDLTVILIIVIVVLLIEVKFRPRIDTKSKNRVILRYYNLKKERKHLIIW